MSAEMKGPSSPRRRVLLIGWDAADWKIINPLLDAGLMPTLERFINAGVMGNLATLQPILSPMLWNSIATGKRAYKHGIHGFMEVKADGTGVQPVMSTSRQAKALWNILSQSGLKNQVFGWFASHPAEPIEGVCVSNLFHQTPKDLSAPWPIPAGSVHPPRLAATLSGLRVHPTEIEGSHLQPFIPRANEIDQKDEVGQTALNRAAKILADCASIHATATWAMEHEPWDFCAIYYDAIDHFCHAFMPFHPPRREGVDEKWFDLLRDVVNGVYRFHDMMLARLLQLAGDDTTVIIVSDHGFHSDHLRPTSRLKIPAGPTVWHRPYGIIAVNGPGCLTDERLYGASILDIAPTILALFGLPIGQDMDGKPLVEAFADPPSLSWIPSWEDVAGDAGTHPKTANNGSDAEAADQALQQLVELGYIEPLSDDENKLKRIVRLEGQFNLAVSLADGNRVDDAIIVLQELLLESQEERFVLALAQAYLSQDRLADARKILEPLLKNAGQDTASPEKGSPSEVQLGRVELMLGILDFREGHTEEALGHFLQAEAANPRLPRLHNQLGYVYLRQRDWLSAERAFQKALSIDGDNARACHGLSIARLRQGSAAEAAELSLRAIGLQHFFPPAHFQLGLVLMKLGWPERAAQAFETGLHMRPASPVARRYLSKLYTRLGQSEKARQYQGSFEAPFADAKETSKT